MSHRLCIHEERNRLLVKGYRAGDLLRDAGMRPIYLVRLKAWTVGPHRLTDLAAYLDYRNVSYTVTGRGGAA